MGLGDWIMATSQVKTLHEQTGKKVAVIDHLGRVRWSEVFDNNPRLSKERTGDTVSLLNCGGHRPYIQSKTAEKWHWRKWDKKPGELYLTKEEMQFASPWIGCIYIEPNTKMLSSNKAWPFARWQQLVDRIGPDRFIQTGVLEARKLRGVPFMPTTFRQAVAIMQASRVYVGAEGGMHHAAAALNRPAIVLWSEFISPEFTGYDFHKNLRHAQGWCGSRLPCHGCQSSMEAITVDEVATSLKEYL